MYSCKAGISSSYKQFVQELQPACRCWCFWHIGDGQSVHAVFFFRGKVTVCKIRTVSDMNTIRLNLRWFGCAGQLDGLHDMFNAPRYTGGGIIANLLIDFLFQWSFIFHHAIHGEQSALKAAHGVLAQKVICKQWFNDFPVVAHPVSGGCAMLLLRFLCIVRLLFQGRSLPFR